MRPAVIVKTNPVANDAAGVLQGLEAMPMYALLLQRPNDTFHHPVLLRRVRRNELLAQAIATNQRGVTATGEDQAVVAAEQKWCRHPAQCAVSGNERLLQRRLRRLRLAGTRQLPSQQLPGVAIEHQR